MHAVMATPGFTAPIWFARIARRQQSEIDRWRGWLNEQNL